MDLGKPPIDEQIRGVEWAIERCPDLRYYLKLHKAVVEAQRELRRNPKKGTLLDWSDSAFVRRLQVQAETTGQPIITLLKLSMVDEDRMRDAAIRIIDALIRHGVGGSPEALRRKLTSGAFSISDLVDALIESSDERVLKIAGRLGVEDQLLIFLAHMLIQPLAEQIAHQVDPSFLERWGRPICPVCGVKPVVEWTIQGKRFLSCMLCGVRFPVEPFLCIFCGNKDPYTLKSLVPDDHPAFRVDYCERCRHYTKVIIETRLKERIPAGLEDLLTYGLDLAAVNAGLVRGRPTSASPTEARYDWRGRI
jgi:formate dehydrogenase maturation protein FdhE